MIKADICRNTALQALSAVKKDGAYATAALQRLFDEGDFAPRDKSLITELVNGTLRREATIDYYLTKLLKNPLGSFPLWILLILRLSLYQLLYLPKIPQSAVVDEAVKLAKRYGHQGTASLINAVLRSFLRQKDSISLPDKDKQPTAFLAVYGSLSDELAVYFIELFGLEGAMAFCDYQNAAQPVHLRANRLKITREALQARLAEQGFAATACAYAPDALAVASAAGLFDSGLFAQGLFSVQDEASQLAALALAPKQGSLVLDLCAAPGGKTTYLAEQMADSGTIEAFDLYAGRVALIEQNCRRLGLTCVKAAAADALQLPDSYLNKADYILLDAPCSGLGVLGRRADSRARKDLDDLPRLAQLSYDLLVAAADYLKAGGVLVYSTCTVSREENADNISRFLAARSDFTLQSFPDGFPLADNGGMLQLLPQTHGTEGFFIARLRKEGN